MSTNKASAAMDRFLQSDELADKLLSGSEGNEDNAEQFEESEEVKKEPEAGSEDESWEVVEETSQTEEGHAEETWEDVGESNDAAKKAS